MEIDFSSGVTAIIGPNGSGKSNIFDGIRWVLGETSAKSLRGGKMTDVIFSGCETRGKSKEAEVTLTFDNKKRIIKHHADEIIISRKASLDGRSQYFINGETTRLKDIQEMFMDTGVGNDSYSMIGQEQTKKLLSSKLEDRRAIFEEASGIVRLRKQKEVTEKRLGSIEQNFLRLKDILGELEKQLKPLEKQKNKAEDYLRITDELKGIEVNYLSDRVKHHSSIVDKKTSELQSNLTELDTINQQLHSLELDLSNYKEKVKLENAGLLGFRDKKSEYEKDLRVTQTNINNLQDKEKLVNKRKKELELDVNELKTKINTNAFDVKEKTNELSDIEFHLSDLLSKKEQTELDLTSCKQDVQSLKLDIEKKRDIVVQLFNQTNELKLQFEQNELEKKSIANSLTELEDLNISSEVNRLIREQEETDLLINKITDELDRLQRTKNNYHQKQELLLDEIKKSEGKINQIRMETDVKLNELNRLESSSESKDFLFFSVRKILENKHTFEGLLGIFSDLVQPRPGYEIAIDSLLGNVTQYVIVEEFSDAKPIIQYLKKNKYGSASFIGLKDAKPRCFNSNELHIIQSTNGLHVTTDLVSHDPLHSPIVQQTLGRSLIAEDLDIALNFIKHNKMSVKIATLTGEVLQPGVLSGGYNAKKGLYSMQSKIQTTQESIQENNEKIFKCEQHLGKLQSEFSSFKNKIELLNEELEQKTELKHTYIHTSQKIELEKKNADEKEMSVLLKLQEEKDKLTLIQKKCEVDFRKLDESESSYIQSESDLNQTLEELSNKENDVEQLTNILHALEKEMVSLSSKKDTITQYIKIHHNGSGDVELKLQQLTNHIQQADEDIKEIHKELENLTLRESELSIMHKDISCKVTEGEHIYQSLEESLERVENDVKENQKKKELTIKANHSLEIEVKEHTNQLNQYLKRASEQYSLERSYLLALPNSEIDVEETKKEIMKLKGEIKKIGSVNVDSITHHKEIKDRFDREKNQFEDVISAKKDLTTLLNEVTNEMKERFVQTFKEISSHFETTFTDLFGGGKAKLSLVHPNQPLSSHIDILVQPPGKKSNNIELLSGGEKALTVSALIFAIVKTKPSPFVYLDEIDAPLDDVNVSRFAFHLSKYSEDTQFIVVTHRKGTMMTSDVIFGVTQEIRGITTVFPHYLETAKKEA